MRQSLTAFYFFTVLIIICITACENRSQHHDAPTAEEFNEWVNPAYVLDEEAVKAEIHKQQSAFPHKMYADAHTSKYYQESRPMAWFTRTGVSEQADSLLTWLEGTDDLGFSKEFFHTDTLRSLIARVKDFDFGDEGASLIGGRLEFLLTQAFIRYASGQRYGYIHPRHVFNKLLVDQPAAGEVRKTVRYRRIYDQESEELTDSFVHHAIDEVRHHRLGSFLQEIQPTDTLFRQMQREYLRAKSSGDTARLRLAQINRERARWRYPHPSEGSFIFVNLASQELTAVNPNRDSVLTMRVCCGNASHKTPLLHSNIKLVELNPYWVIPQTIVRKEIAPRHVGDSAYFARNSYRAINKKTKEELNPSVLTSAQLRSGEYTLRQERGAGNSLGRIIFRFPNNFSVYLHDTNSRGTFKRTNRAVSHGCVRLEKPLTLALYMLDDASELYIDRIRMAIDLSPISSEGKRYKAANPNTKHLGRINYPEPIPVWLDYWTLYPDTRGQLQSHPDKYGYDEVIEKILNDY